MMMTLPRRLFVLALILVSLPAGVCLAQTPNTAALTGRVVDESHEGLPGVRVTLSNPRVAMPEQSVMTDIEGNYSFRLVPPGAGYMVEAFIPDYAKVIAGPVELVSGRFTALNLTLKKSADLQETVHVEATGEIVDTSSAKTSTSYNAELIEGVPLLGRNFSDVLTLAPGVTDTDGDGNPNVRGARDTGLQLRLDGSNVTNPLTGKSGQNINLETIEDVEVITAGAAAEYGRADGGFANVITKSGGNDLDGSVKLFYRSDFLDGSGANSGGSATTPSFNDTDLFLTVGGPMVRDRLWYFTSAEYLDHEVPVTFGDGTFALKSEQGWRAFGKLTWQANSDNKLAFQVTTDPLKTDGNNLGQFISGETDYQLKTGGPVAQITWTSIISPTLLLQLVLSNQNGNLEIDPTSSLFQPVVTQQRLQTNGSLFFLLPCKNTNCTDEPGLRRFIHGTSSRGRELPVEELGPYSFSTDQNLQRTTMKSDLSYTIEDALGRHSIKTGVEFNIESYNEDSVNNPVVTDYSCAYQDCGISVSPPPPPLSRLGTLLLQIYDPLMSQKSADGFNVGAYVQDSWKPIPSLAVNLGLRVDREEIDTGGFIDFDPRVEAREALRRFDEVCDAAGSVCTSTRVPGRRIGSIPSVFPIPPGHPANRLDLNHDGYWTNSGAEAAQLTAPFTTSRVLTSDQFYLDNTNLSPRLSLSWDPWADGKTKFFGSWGKYYDRLFLGSVTTGQDPKSYAARWELNFNAFQARPGSASQPATAFSISQTDRNIQTPYTIEWTLGAERELAPEWSVSVTYVSRRGIGLLQDVDINHIPCEGFDNIFNVAPMAVCGDGGRLERDRFGQAGTGSSGQVPNGVPDLYNLNPNFNQVFRVGNYNSSTYTSAEILLHRRLYHNWQMQFGYTWSKAYGDAESFTSSAGNDPAVSDKVSGYLDFDQRHILKFQVVTRLPHEILLGSTILWASGLPYSLISNAEDLDDFGNLTPNRVFSLTGQKNDQRNDAQLTVNAHVEKRLDLGGTQLSGFLDVDNILDSDDLQLTLVDREARNVVNGTRRFGRRWQIGAAFFF